jgi:hypothetical protein
MCSQISQANAQATKIRAAKPNSTCGKESEGAYKQSNQQKGVTRSVYCEHGDKMDQFAPTPALQ